MESSFNISRLFKYFRYNLSIHYKTYIISCIILFIALTGVNYMQLYSSHKYDSSNYLAIYSICFCLSAILVIGTSFPELRNKAKTIYFLTIPASILEKYVVQFFIRIIGFIGVYHLFFWLSLKTGHYFYLLTDFKKHYIIYDYGFFTNLKNYSNLYFNDNPVLSIFIGIITLLCFSLFTGTIVYKKNALFKTLFSIVIFCFGIYVVLLIYSHMFRPGVTHGFYPELYSRHIHKSLDAFPLLIIVITNVTSLLLIPLAYYKLKEKQV